MNKVEFKDKIEKFLSEYNIAKCDAYVSHGGTLLLLGMREVTNDIDLTVSKEVWDKFIEDGYPVKIVGGNIEIIEFKGNIDVHCDDGDMRDLMYIEGVLSRSPERTLRDKMSLNREKDKVDIDNLKRFIYGK